jgi:thiol-disulfide isomerase/thioredoxin
MQSIPLGPLALPLNPLLLMGGWWLASAVAERLAGPQRAVAAKLVLQAALAGLLVARGVFVVQGWRGYAQSPLTVIDLRDGGWAPWPGLVAALLVLGFAAWRRAELRRALATGAAAGLAFWGGLSTLLGVHESPALPALQRASLDGRPMPLLDAGDPRPMVVNLWATWCAPCREEMPMLAAAAQRERGVRFVFVNHGESAVAVQRFLSAQPYRLEGVLLDERMALGSAIGSAGLPTTLFLDRDDAVVARHMGPLNAASLAARLDTLRPPTGGP